MRKFAIIEVFEDYTIDAKTGIKAELTEGEIKILIRTIEAGYNHPKRCPVYKKLKKVV